MDLYSLFIQARADDARQADSYRARAAPGYERHFIAATPSNLPAILISPLEAVSSVPSIELENLSVHYGTSCLVVSDKGTTTSNFIIIVCRSTDTDVQRYFLQVAAPLLSALGSAPSPASINEAILSLVELFRNIQAPPFKAAAGLFGEIIVIDLAKDTSAAISAWHAINEATFDFASGLARMEVKVTSARNRAHEFSFAQCSPPRGTYGILVSIQTEQLGGGTTIDDLLERIERRISGRSDLLLKLRMIVSRSLGSAMATGLKVAFDEAQAKATLRYYDVSSIPAIREPLPSRVSAVRFVSDLSESPSISLRELRQRCPDATSLLPT